MVETKSVLEQLIVMCRLDLYNHGFFYGANAVRRKLVKYNIQPLPSASTIHRIITRNSLTHQRTGKY